MWKKCSGTLGIDPYQVPWGDKKREPYQNFQSIVFNKLSQRVLNTSVTFLQKSDLESAIESHMVL